MGLTSTRLAISKDGAVKSFQDFIYNRRNCGVIQPFLTSIGSKNLVKVIGASKLLAVDILVQCDLTVGLIAFDNLGSASCNLFLRRRPGLKNRNKYKDDVKATRCCLDHPEMIL
jgi:hypothetical protein